MPSPRIRFEASPRWNLLSDTDIAFSPTFKSRFKNDSSTEIILGFIGPHPIHR